MEKSDCILSYVREMSFELQVMVKMTLHVFYAVI